MVMWAHRPISIKSPPGSAAGIAALLALLLGCFGAVEKSAPLPPAATYAFEECRPERHGQECCREGSGGHREPELVRAGIGALLDHELSMRRALRDDDLAREALDQTDMIYFVSKETSVRDVPRAVRGPISNEDVDKLGATSLKRIYYLWIDVERPRESLSGEAAVELTSIWGSVERGPTPPGVRHRRVFVRSYCAFRHSGAMHIGIEGQGTLF